MTGSDATIKPAFVLDLAQAQAIVDRFAPRSRVVSLEELHGGAISRVYGVACTDESSPDLVIKTYPELLHWKLAKEVFLYRYLAGNKHLPVPRVLWHDDSRTIVPLAVLVLTRLDGQILQPLEASLSDDDLFGLYAQMGRTLRHFHDVRMAAFGYLVGGGVKDPHASNDAYMLFQFDKKLREFRQCGGSEALAARMARHVAAGTHLLKASTLPVFCHDDFHTGNVLVRHEAGARWQLTGVVDVENAVAGDPLLDIAKTLLYSVGESLPKRNGLLAGYGPIDRPQWQAAVDLYRMYHALEWWDWTASIGGTPPDWLIGEMERVTAVDIR